MQIDLENALTLLDLEAEMDEVEHQMEFGAAHCDTCDEVIVAGLNDTEHYCL